MIQRKLVKYGRGMNPALWSPMDRIGALKTVASVAKLIFTVFARHSMCDHSTVKCLLCGVEDSPAALLGSKPRTMTDAAKKQRQDAAKKPRPNRSKKEIIK
jgi:hypothetical protein